MQEHTHAHRLQAPRCKHQAFEHEEYEEHHLILDVGQLPELV
jgi:hypothetical protein